MNIQQHKGFFDTDFKNVLGDESTLRASLGHPAKHQSYEVSVSRSKSKLDGGTDTEYLI